ncbi:hypothetical protein EXS57_02470 [Candidatus Kaiserbacteria bacterium]|nr:hypothetical protein [Candidatus Kaiserbacteria bacterium]
MRRDHFFDWSGFKFAVKMLVLCIVAGSLGRYGLLYAAQSHTSSGPSLVLIQETRPAAGKSLSLTLSTTTSQHIINTLTISDAIPASGKFIGVDLRTMVLTLYQDGVAFAKYPIRSKEEMGSPYETPAGIYNVLEKETDHFNTVEQIDLPWSIQFSANYFMHGLPYDGDGSPAHTIRTGSGIQLDTEDAKEVYEFAEKGTNIFVFDPLTPQKASLVLDAIPLPSASALSYMVADIDTGDVFLEQNAGDVLPMGPAMKLVAALVTNEMIPIDKKNNTVQTYDVPSFVDWMNIKKKTLDMQSTHFVSTVSTSTENTSTTEDLFRLTTYLANRKTFILEKNTTKDPVISIIPIPINGVERRIAIIVLQSEDAATDVTKLTDWFTQSALQGADIARTACITCALPAPYRKITF